MQPHAAHLRSGHLRRQARLCASTAPQTGCSAPRGVRMARRRAERRPRCELEPRRHPAAGATNREPAARRVLPTQTRWQLCMWPGWTPMRVRGGRQIESQCKTCNTPPVLPTSPRSSGGHTAPAVSHQPHPQAGQTEQLRMPCCWVRAVPALVQLEETCAPQALQAADIARGQQQPAPGATGLLRAEQGCRRCRHARCRLVGAAAPANADARSWGCTARERRRGHMPRISAAPPCRCAQGVRTRRR